VPSTRSTQILVAVALPLVVLSIDFSGVAVALPQIGDDFGVSSAATGWVINAFALGAAGPLLVSGRTSDRFGRRRMLLIGVGSFCAGTLGAALAPTFGVLIAARGLQGLATSMFMTASLSTVSNTFSGERRAWGIGMWSAIGSTAAAAAPVVGGTVVELLGWRWFFAMNVPLLLVAAFMIARDVPETFGDRQPIDVVGAVLATLSVTLVVYGFQEAGTYGWSSPEVFAPLGGGAVLFGVFVAQQRSSAHPLIEPAIARARQYRPPVGVAFLANWGFGALNILLTFWLQEVRGLSASTTGLVFLAYSVPFAVLGALTGRVVPRWGSRLPMVVGMALVTASFVTLTTLGTTSPIGIVVVAMALSGVGQGLAYNVSTTAAMASVPDEDAGVASGLLTALRNVGVAAGVAVATLATASPGGTTGAAADADFAAGVSDAAWGIAVVSFLGLLVALLAAPRPAVSPTPAR
jgi:MFS family permease